MPITEADTQNEPMAIDLRLIILGRTLEHFGVQMYKQRPAAIAELVANCWDSGSPKCGITLPDPSTWNSPTAEILIEDSGCGMSETDVQRAYLVLGRNRREDKYQGGLNPYGRRIMGRKGIGKLAGFGIADEIVVRTWKEGIGTQFTLRLDDLASQNDEVRDVQIPGSRFIPEVVASKSGTMVVLRRLRNKTPLDAGELRKSLARRFGHVVKGEMAIKVNEVGLPDPLTDYGILQKFPDDFPEELQELELESGKVIRYGFAFTRETIKNSEMQGFVILVHGKTAQAPPFFFRVEATASGQHATRYVSGVIEADFLDDATDSKSDVISTDRQEIDWNHPACEALSVWGSNFARKCLADCTEFRGKRKTEELELDPAIKSRIDRLDSGSKKLIHKMIGVIGYTNADEDRTKELVDSLLKVFEFRHFHDMVDEISEMAENPKLLIDRLKLVREWKVLESRAIHEIIQGRLAIIEVFEQALTLGFPETAHNVGQSNLHDAIGRFPWLLNPDYHIFAEEKTIKSLLYTLAGEEHVDLARERVDFCAIGDDSQLVIIEIKRSTHAVEFDEIQRIDRYAEKIARSTRKTISRILIYGGTLNISETSRKPLEGRTDFELREWGSLFDATKQRYKRYKAVLEGDINHPDFSNAQREVDEVRSVVESASFYRTTAERQKGLGSQET